MQSRTAQRWLTAVAGAGVAALAVAGPAAAATSKPSATTGAPSSIAQTTVTLNGTVNPHGLATQYQFQYGTTMAYGTSTPGQSAGSGTTGKKVTAAVSGLQPATKYHVRLIAINAKGRTNGADRTFTTQPQPLALSLNATPNPLRWGRDALIGGTLSGTGNGGKAVAVQYNPFPYTGPWQQLGNKLLTESDGSFGVVLPNVSTNTQLRAQMPQKPNVVSAVVTLLVKEKVTIHVNRHHVTRGHKVRFSGSITPAADGSTLKIQRHTSHGWHTVARTTARRRSAGGRSTYHRRVRIHHGGRYRVRAVITSGANEPGSSSSKHLHVHH